MKHKIIEIVDKKNTAILNRVINGKVTYQIPVEDSIYELELDSTDEDWKTTYMLPEFKTIYLMRWINKGIKLNDGTFIQIK